MKKRTLLSLCLPVLGVVVLAIGAVGISLTRSDIAKLEATQQEQLKLADEIVASALLSPLNQIQGMLREPAVKKAFRLPLDEATSAVQAQLTTLLYRNEPYDQARWLSKDGDELVRVRQGDEIPVAVPRDELINKSNRDWFKNTVAQAPGAIYVSALDLNLIGDVVEVPVKPALRFGVRLPVERDRDFGILVVNLRAAELLERLRSIKRLVPGESMLLLNPQGYWLLTPERQDAFSFALGAPENSFAKRQPAEWARISTQAAGQMISASGLWSWNTIDPAVILDDKVTAAETWKLVTHVPAATIAEIRWNRWEPLLLLGATILGAMLYGLYEYRKFWLKREVALSERALTSEKSALEQRLQLATEGADVGVWYWDTAGEALEWSEQCKKHLALPEGKEPTFDHFYAAIHPEDRERVRGKIEEAVKNRTDYYEEYRIVNPDGSVRWIAAPGKIFTKPDGTLKAMSGVTIDITKLKTSEASLRELTATLKKKVEERTAEVERSRALLATVLGSLLDLHVLLRAVRDKDGKIVDLVYAEANEAACLYNKCTREQLIGKSLLEVLPGTRAGGAFDMFCKVIETGEPLVRDDFPYEHEAQSETRWFDMRGVRVEDMLSLIARDVTDRRKVQQDLADSQRSFQMLAENASDVVFEADAAGIVTYVSPSSATSLGRSPEQITGMPFRNLVHPDEWDSIESLEDQMTKGTPAKAEVRLRIGDDGYQWFSLSMKPLMDANGAVAGSVGGLRDIQREVQVREAVKAERQRLKATIDSLLEPLILMQPVWDKDGHVADFIYAEANPAACAWLQTDRDHLLGLRLLELFPALENTGLMNLYRDTAETGRQSVVDDFPFPMGERTVWLDVRAVRVDERVSFAWRDVTERHLTTEKITTSEERYRLLAMNMSDVIVRLDEQNRIAWVSPSLKSVLGWDVEQWVGREVTEFLADSSANEQFHANKAMVTKGQTILTRVKMRAKDGTSHWVEVHAGPYRDKEGKITGAAGSFRVIDAEVQAEQEKLHQQEIIANERKYLVDVIEGSDTGTWEWYVQTGALVINEVWAKLLGYRLEEIAPATIGTWEKFTHPDDLAKAKVLLERCFRRESEFYEVEARMRHRNGEWVWILTRGRIVEWTEDGKPWRMLGTHRDITANMHLRQKLEREATTDALTDLCNRREFESLAHRELSRANRQGAPLSLLMMDIDKFKSINDTHGHDVGDAVLKTIAGACAPHLREVDVLARIGGEEFAVLLPDTTIDGATHVAERIREALGRESVPAGDGKTLSFTVSVGVAQHDGESEELPALIKRADQALYRAKESGRNRVCTG